MSQYILEMNHITKEFTGVKALDDVNLKVKPGEIMALCGENGAGKSTLMNVLSGTYGFGSYTGDIVYNGETCQFHNLRDSEAKGIVIIHQELALSPYLSIAENVFLGNEQMKVKGVIDWNITRAKAADLLKQVGLGGENVNTPVMQLGTGKQQLVEIAKALGKKCDLLILDEPTASLNDEESMGLLNLMLELKRQGITQIIISHKLNEISYVADAITVIRDGHTIETMHKGEDYSLETPESYKALEDRIIKSMVGRELTNRYPKRHGVKIGTTPVFEVKNWNVYHPELAGKKVLNDVNLVVRPGEVVGLAGLMGAGRTELAMSVFGRSYGTDITGEVFINGQKVDTTTVSKAIDAKLAYVSEDRKTYGLVLIDSIEFNSTLAAMKNYFSKNGILNRNEEKVKSEEYRRKLKTKCNNIEQPVGDLSGGNQQKVVLAKWMLTQPEILIMDEPTRGIDVGAKYEIYEVINELAADGKGVIVISSDMQEIIGTCDRTYVLNEGEICGELVGADITQENIMGCIMAHNNRKGAAK